MNFDERDVERTLKKFTDLAIESGFENNIVNNLAIVTYSRLPGGWGIPQHQAAVTNSELSHHEIVGAIVI